MASTFPAQGLFDHFMQIDAICSILAAPRSKATSSLEYNDPLKQPYKVTTTNVSSLKRTPNVLLNFSTKWPNIYTYVQFGWPNKAIVFGSNGRIR
ncbi:hypothetical protein Syun_028365 [Stephania yunnanensis]|uniref:Uncharacterized protein n=1 Tax=Stephania yunnanensis TaxID=152371 RepID=A0AAP0EHL9_9MAGN